MAFWNSFSFHNSLIFFLLLFVVCCCCCKECYGFGTFGFDIHHRFSDPVKGILAVDELPEKGSLKYYATMAHRDRLIHGRKLAKAENQMQQTQVTFADGNDTYRLDSLGYLHYANVSVGTPSLSFIVALDTGSDLFWLPCDCSSCVRGLSTQSGDRIDFNIYSPSTSNTSAEIPCSSKMCGHQRKCSSDSDSCPYEVMYLSNGTASSGFYVEDVLHLVTDNSQSKDVRARIMFGCGKVQTGSFLNGAAPNGLFGLGMSNISVPSILSKEGVISNSFSMCFAPDGVGRITFGDKGSADQGETPFSLRQTHPTYNISITQLSVGSNVANTEFSAIFDSGTSFTYLNDPAYTLISQSFNSQAHEKRHLSDSGVPFEYCYDLSPNQENFSVPTLKLTMKGGDEFAVSDPIAVVPVPGGAVYCLAVVKSEDVNIIGQNFMTGYRIVFDREKMVLGWKASNCYDANKENTLPVNPQNSKAVPPAVAVNPEATAGMGDNSKTSMASPPITFHSSPMLTFYHIAVVALLPFFVIH